MSVRSICQRGYLFAKVCSSLSVQQFSLSIRKVVPSDTDLRAKPTLRTTICNLVAVWESSSKITWSSSGHSCMAVFVSVCFLGLQTPKSMGPGCNAECFCFRVITLKEFPVKRIWNLNCSNRWRFIWQKWRYVCEFRLTKNPSIYNIIR